MTGAKYDGHASRDTSPCSDWNVSGASNAPSHSLEKSRDGVRTTVSMPDTSEFE
jgi:hypothetical protein